MSKSSQELEFNKTLASIYTTSPTNKNKNNINSNTNNSTQQGGHHRSRSRKFTKNYSIDVQGLLAKGKELYQGGLLKEALFFYEEVIRNVGNQKQKDHQNQKQKQKDTQKDKEELSWKLDALYHAATIHMSTNNHTQACVYLSQLAPLTTPTTSPSQTPTHTYTPNPKTSNTLLLLSICLAKTNHLPESLRILDRLCQEKCVDGLFYRGRLRMRGMDFGGAEGDFGRLVDEMGCGGVQARIFLVEARVFGSGRGDRDKMSKNLQDICAIQKDVYKETDKRQQNIRKYHNLKATILLELNLPKQAQQQLHKLSTTPISIKIKPDSWTLYLQSKIAIASSQKQPQSQLQLQQQQQKQILLLNQCISCKDHKRSVMYALRDLIIICIRQRDFYEAFEYSKRNSFLKITYVPILKLLKITQAVTFLMKKKYGQALLLIGAIDPTIYKQLGNPSQYQFIKNLHYSALGYAYFSLGQHADSLKQYAQITTDATNQQHLSYRYNKKLCQGILTYKNQHKIEQSIKIFQSATDHLMRAQPYFYISVILVQKNLAGQTDPELIMKVIEIIDSGLKVGENYQMYYYRALLYFYLGMNVEALDDVDRAVEKSEENVARFFYLRGLIFFQERNYENAAAELTTCLSIDDKFYNAYLQRAKIRLLSQQPQQAYQDLANHPLQQQWLPLFLLHQHNFTQIIHQKIGQEWVRELCAFQLGKFDQAGPAGKVVMAVIGENYEEVMNLLQDALDINFQIGCLGIEDIYMMKSYCCYRLGLVDGCLEMLGKCQECLKKNQSSLGFGEEDEKKLLAIKVNTIYCHLFSKNLELSLELCQSLINDVYEGNVYDQLNKIKTHIEYLKTAPSQPPQTQIQLFIGSSLISDYLPLENLHFLHFHYLIPFPKIRVAEIENVPYEQPLLQFTIDQIDNRAEAPWMHKGEHGIIFTNKIEVFDNLRLYTQTEENQSNKDKEKEKDKNSKERMKQELQLDAEVLNRLEKLSKNVKVTKSSGAV